MNSIQLVGIAGSLRARSFSRAALAALTELAPASIQISLTEIGHLPFYNEDLDIDGGPESVEAFKAMISNADGLLIATPEYNYSVPGVLKNAIDWASRPAYRSPLAGKPVAAISVSKGAVGGARSLGHLKQILAGTLSHVFPFPEVLLSAPESRFDADMALQDAATREVLTKFLAAFERYVRRFPRE